MGLFGFLRRGKSTLPPEPGTPEFERLIAGSALPDSQSVAMGAPGWASTAAPTVPPTTPTEAPTTRVDLSDTAAREQISELLRTNGIDPDAEGQRIDASSVPGLADAVLDILQRSGVDLPRDGMTLSAGGSGGAPGAWIGSAAAADPHAQIEHLKGELEAGRISASEFEAQKRYLLD